MIKIPLCFKDKGEYYLTTGPLQVFCKNNKLPTNEDRTELIKYIEKFANENEDNQIIVLEWLEELLKEGVKHIYVRKCFFPSYLEECTEEVLESIIKEKLGDIEQEYIIGGTHSNQLKCLSYTYEYNEDKISKICFTYSMMLAELKKGKTSHNKIIYPIFIDIDFNNKVVIGRAKSKNGIYEFKYGDQGQFIPNIEKANTFKLVTKIMNEIALSLDITYETKDRSRHIWSSNFYELINECTQTPEEVEFAINGEEAIIEEFIQNFFVRHNISPINKDNYIKAKEDIKLFMEKYLAINLDNEAVFKENRVAYPIKIATTDTDLTSVEQCTANRRPLQASPVFYDNKKILLRRKQCDKISLVFKREKKTYITNDEFVITLEVKGGYCVIQTVSYLLEEDIQDVLSRVIRVK